MIDYKSYISSAVISDVLASLGYENQLLPNEIKPNFLKARIFGRARTLTLKELSNGQDYRGIYKSLNFVAGLNSGEVLVVANGFNKLAFFGELMATLAQCRGVDGVVIDGCTRDTVETIEMGYPVFARAHYARDIKKRGTIDALDTKVHIGECTIQPGDLLFGDYDAVAVIPQKIQRKVIARCIEVVNLEKRIKEDIRQGVDIKDILRKRGEF